MDEIKVFGISDVGMVRVENEDSFLIIEENDKVLVCVADGMGGHIGGKIASSTTVETIKTYYENNRNKAPIDELIEDAMILSDSKIKVKTSNIPPGLSMGTTCTIAVLAKSSQASANGQTQELPQGTTSDSGLMTHKISVTFGHIGDSRLYHFSENRIVQISKDHSLLQRLLDSGALKPEEVENYQYKNVIYKSLGGMDTLALDFPEKFIINKGDILLLCSDGLTGYIKDSELLNIVNRETNIIDASENLVNLAKYRGGNDNITVIIVEYGDFKRSEKVKTKNKLQEKKRLIILLLLLTITILSALISFEI